MRSCEGWGRWVPCFWQCNLWPGDLYTQITTTASSHEWRQQRHTKGWRLLALFGCFWAVLHLKCVMFVNVKQVMNALSKKLHWKKCFWKVLMKVINTSADAIVIMTCWEVCDSKRLQLSFQLLNLVTSLSFWIHIHSKRSPKWMLIQAEMESKGSDSDILKHASVYSRS